MSQQYSATRCRTLARILLGSVLLFAAGRVTAQFVPGDYKFKYTFTVTITEPAPENAVLAPGKLVFGIHENASEVPNGTATFDTFEPTEPKDPNIANPTDPNTEFTDLNGDGVWDSEIEFDDLNGNGVYDPETEDGTDTDGDNHFDAGGYDRVLDRPPPGGGGPFEIPVYVLYFHSIDASTPSSEYQLTESIREERDTVRWGLEFEVEPYIEGAQVTLTRAADGVLGADYFTGRAVRILTLKRPNGQIEDLLTNLGGEYSITLSEGLHTIVCAVDRPLIASDDAATLGVNSPETQIDVIANDTPGAGATTLTITGVKAPDQAEFQTDANTPEPTREGGAVTFAGNVINYTPPAGFAGEDEFDYRVRDELDSVDTAKVTVTLRDILMSRAISLSQPILGQTFTVSIDLAFNAGDLQTLELTEFLPITSAASRAQEGWPNYWEYVPDSFQITGDGWSPVGIEQVGTEVTFDFGDVDANATALQFSYDVFAPAPGTEPRRITGEIRYNKGAGDLELISPETSFTPRLPDAPYLAYDLVDTYSFVGVPFTDTGIADAAALAASIVTATDVYRWTGAGWETYTPGSRGNFAITPGYPYLAKVNAPAVGIYAGATWADPTFTLSAGHNVILLSEQKVAALTTADAEHLAQHIVATAAGVSACRYVWQWDAERQSWQAHRTGSELNNFTVAAGQIVMVLIEGAGDW